MKNQTPDKTVVDYGQKIWTEAKTFVIDRKLPLDLLDRESATLRLTAKRLYELFREEHKKDIGGLYMVAAYDQEGNTLSGSSQPHEQAELIDSCPEGCFLVLNPIPNQQSDVWEPVIILRESSTNYLLIPLKEGVTPISPSEYFSVG